MRRAAQLLLWIRRGLDLAAAVLLLAMLAVTAARVTGRYLLDLSMPWSEELTRLLFVWLVLIAAARARHMGIDLLPDAVPLRQRRLLRLGATVIGAGLLALLVYLTFDLIELTSYDRFTALGISVQYLYWSVVVGGLFWILLSLAEHVSPSAADRAEPPPA